MSNVLLYSVLDKYSKNMLQNTNTGKSQTNTVIFALTLSPICKQKQNFLNKTVLNELNKRCIIIGNYSLLSTLF